MKQVLGVEVQPTVVSEPVLDVPAIDMTTGEAETTNPSKPAARKKPRTRARSKANQSGRATKADAQPKSTRDGSVGRDTFERVEALVKDGMTKSEGFKLVAADTGKNIGTVSANYYRVARANGAAKPRQPAAKAASVGGTRGRQNAASTLSRRDDVRADNADGNVDQIVGQFVANVQALTEAIRAQDAEVRELRGRLDGVRTALR
jgi:hypothetical protein